MSVDVDDPWVALVGQSEAARRLAIAVDSPVHAYLFVGPSGVGKQRAAAVFAGELLAAADPEGAARHRRLAAEFKHPDVVVFSPAGTNLRLGSRQDPGEIPAIVREATRSPTEGKRKIVVVDQFHSADAPASSALLKLVEEPPASTIFVLLATSVPPHQVTIESRCTRIDFPAIASDDIVASLVADDLCGVDQAAVVALAANGSIDRARVLVTDERLAARRTAWWSVPERLDGTGAAVASMVEEIRDLIDDALKVKVAHHNAEAEALDEREERLGTRGSGRREMEARHRREIRQFRTEELQFGLATLAHRYREPVLAGDPRPELLDAVGRLRDTADALVRNPNEALLLQALFLKLPPL